MDAGYAEAFYLLAQAYERIGRKELAKKALAKADRKSANLFHGPRSGAPRLLAANKRLAAALREDALCHGSSPLNTDRDK